MLSRENIQNIYKLSPMQEGMFFHASYDKDSSAYFQQVCFGFRGDLDIKLVEKSLGELFKRHDILRTVFVQKKDTLLQVVLKERPPDFYYEDISGRKDRDRYLGEYRERDRRNTFDLTRDVLLRLAVFRSDEKAYTFIWSYHHILMDGWCLGLLVSEYLEMYNSFLEGRPSRLSEVVQYRTYIDWLQKQDREASERYWRKYLEHYEEAARVSPKNRSDYLADGNDPGQKEVSFYLERNKTIGLNKLAGKHQVTLNIIMQTIWGIILGKYNDSRDVVFGAVVSGRPAEIEGVESMIGLFINTVPVRIRWGEEIKFNHLLREVQERALEGEPHHYCSLAEIQSESEFRQDLFDHILVFENYPMGGAVGNAPHDRQGEGAGGSTNSSIIESFEETNYDFNIRIVPDEQIAIGFLYNQNLYDSAYIEKIAHHFVQVAGQILVDEESYVCDLSLLSPEERRQILSEFNDTEGDYPAERMVHEWFERQVGVSPDRAAVVFRDKVLTYNSLNENANRLARTLRANGVDSPAVVGILAERSLEMMTGILGILKAGGAYLPIDPGYPQARVDFMLKDSAVALCLGCREYIARYGNDGRWLDLEDRDLYRGNGENLDHRNTPHHLSYVIYTSGSSGKPKGVMVENRSVVNILSGLDRVYPLGKSDVYLLKTPYIFDVSVSELFGWFPGGGSVAILEPGGEKDPHLILDTVTRYNVTHINFVPSMFNAFLEALSIQNIDKLRLLKYIFLAGEAVPPEVVSTFRGLNSGILLENLYGPTEAAVYASRYSLSPWEGDGGVPIGKPMQNVEIFILDRHRRLQAVGLPGELCISGVGLARGYQNNPGLTGEKFADHPWMPGKRLYRTGDLARWLPDGNVEFMGRIDFQIKIRGFRVELGEIESVLLRKPAIREAVVVAKQGTGEGNYRHLCAYIVSDEVQEPEALKAYLSRYLPPHMIPFYFIQLEHMPLTPSGKIDRRALPDAKSEIKGAGEFMAPRNDIEKKLVEIWAEILGLERESLGIDSHFFKLGGHSLRATILTSKIHKAFNVTIPMKRIFEAPTIRSLGQYIKENSEDKYATIEPAEKKEYYALSSAQERMYFLQQMDKKGTGYNMPTSLPLPEVVDKDQFEEAFKKLIHRHESLRTSFDLVGGVPVQRIHREVAFEIDCYDLSSRESDMKAMEVIDHFVAPFDLSRAPLLRVGLVKVAGGHILMVDMHHIISDGTTHDVLGGDFLELYAGRELQPLRLQYKDFSTWQNHLIESGKIKQQEDYWLNLFAGEIPRLNLPTDFPRPDTFTFEGDSYGFKLGSEETRQFKELSLRYNVTLYMNMLAAYNVLLYKYTGRQDIIVGSGVAGRPHSDLQNVIGMFINMLAMRNYPRGGKTYGRFLEEVREHTIRAFENQDVQFEDLIDKLGLERDLSLNPLFDVTIIVQNFERDRRLGEAAAAESPSEAEEKTFDFAPYEQKNKTCKFDLALYIQEEEDEIHFVFEYYSRIFKRETIEKIAHHYLEIIKQVTDDENIKLDDIKMTHGISVLQADIIDDQQMEFEF